MKDIRVEAVSDGIVKLVFPTGNELARAFLRFQENYESPEFKGKVFTREEFLEWYSRISGSNYLEDWDAFNLPVSALKPFLEGEFDPLYPEEQIILEIVRSLKNEYLIGTAEMTEKEDEMHEIAHALYYKNQEYKKEVEAVLNNLDAKAKGEVERFLSKAYHPDVWSDESHAYILFNLGFMKEKGVDVDSSNIAEISKALNEVFAKFYKK